VGKKLFIECATEILFIFDESHLLLNTYLYIQSDQQESKSRVLPHLLFYRNICRRLIRHFYILAVHTRFVGCLPLKNLLLMTFINFL
jgi:hypothetical protein